MPIHVCPNEIAALLIAVPALLVARAWLMGRWRRLHNWIRGTG